MNIRGYDVELQKLSRELGGGFVAYAPALKGCVADGESEEEAIRNVEEAIVCWLDATSERERQAEPCGSWNVPTAT